MSVQLVQNASVNPLTSPKTPQPNRYPYSPEELEQKLKMTRTAVLISFAVSMIMCCVVLPIVGIAGFCSLMTPFCLLAVFTIILFGIALNLRAYYIDCWLKLDAQAVEEYMNLDRAPSNGAIRRLRTSYNGIALLCSRKGVQFDRRSESGETLLGLGIREECARLWLQHGANGDLPWDRPDGESFWELQARSLEPIGETLSLLHQTAEEHPAPSAKPRPFWSQQEAAWETSAPLPPAPPSRWPELLDAINCRS